MQVTQCSMGFLCVFRQVVLTDNYRLTNTHTALIVKVIAGDNEKDDDDSLLQLARSVLMILTRAALVMILARGLVMVLARATLVMVCQQRSADTFV